MSKFYGNYQDAFDAIALNEPLIRFRSGFGRVDDLLNGKLCLGEIVEFCGERNTAKLYLCHSIMAYALISHQKCEQFRFLIFDYAKKFDFKLLRDLVRQRSRFADEKIDALLENVFVQNVVGNNQLHFDLRRLAEVVNEDRVWHCFRNEIATTNTLIFIMDIGSIMQYTNLNGIEGHHLQDEIFNCLQKLANGGAFILMLNHTFETNNSTFPVGATLGHNWRRLVKNRLFFIRDEKDPHLHIAMVKDNNGEKRQVKFKMGVRREGS